MSGLPIHPFSERMDDRKEGVLLLDGYEDYKMTAERIGDYWQIVDWELVDFDGLPHWFPRCWFSISAKHMAIIAKATE